ncbi:MAG TPA: hypothetical protein PLG22_07310 [Kiritimatiellia bacterium]|nr:hypothetical protein [Kiritimatiellia bacterium]
MKNGKSFFNRLELLRGNRSKSQFCKEIGASPPLYQKWKKGSIPGGDKLGLISEKTGRSIKWLMTGIPITDKERRELIAISAAFGHSQDDVPAADDAGLPDMSDKSNSDAQSAPPRADTPCPACVEKDAEIAFLRDQLSKALDRIPKGDKS